MSKLVNRKLSCIFSAGACAIALSCAMGFSVTAFADEAPLADTIVMDATAEISANAENASVEASDELSSASDGEAITGADVADDSAVADADADDQQSSAVDATEESADDETVLEPSAALVVAEEADGVEDDAEPSEAEAAATNGWVKSGSSWYYYQDGVKTSNDWVVTGILPGATSATGSQRYYFNASGALVANQTFSASLAGTTSWFKSVVEGYVVRGVYTDPDTGYIYIADNEGRLLDTGWYCGDVYGDGVERYWVDEDAHACIVGYSDDGWAHYTTDKGYVVRGTYTDSNTGYVYIANNDGRMPGTGWTCGDYGYGLQRYWVDASTHACIPGFSTDGWAHFTTAKGYVLRGIYKDPDTGYVYLADNDGLAPTGGWVCADYGRGFDRYWVDPVVHACIPGYSTDGWAHWTLIWGSTLRGASSWMQDKLYADNNGLLAHDQWVVTSAFGDGLQRYYAGSNGVFLYDTLITEAQGGYYAYATSAAYVVRGTAKDSSTGYIYIANNDGKLLDAGWQVGDYGDGWHRYWIDEAAHAAIPGFSEAGWTHYTLEAGYVLVGKGGDSNYVLIADNDGRLSSFDHEGWYVGTDYDTSIQRYYFTVVYTSTDGKKYYGAKVGLFTVDGKNYYGLENVGYVLRNAYHLINNNTDLFYADNDGVQSDLRNGFLGKGSDKMAGINAWLKVKNMTSSTQYLLVIDDSACAVFVFQGCAGAWTPIYGWDAGVGLHIYNDGQGTVKGTFTIGGDGACYNYSEGGGGGYRVEYYAKDDLKWFTGFCLDAGFHSTIGSEGGYSDPSQTGLHISHGCIRLLEGYAHWIYDNCTVGTKVYSY